MLPTQKMHYLLMEILQNLKSPFICVPPKWVPFNDPRCVQCILSSWDSTCFGWCWRELLVVLAQKKRIGSMMRMDKSLLRCALSPVISKGEMPPLVGVKKTVIYPFMRPCIQVLPPCVPSRAHLLVSFTLFKRIKEDSFTFFQCHHPKGFEKKRQNFSQPVVNWW